MAARTTPLGHQLLRLMSEAHPLSDGDLLRRFIRDRDEAAFAGLVARYSPLVLGVSQRLLAGRATAEDCLQATFLVLAQRASSIRPPGSLAALPHGVAHRGARHGRPARTR